MVGEFDVLFLTSRRARWRRAYDTLVAANRRLLADNGSLRQSNAQLDQALAALTSLQAELLQAAKSAALGSLVVGVSHELNTPIGNSLMAASTIEHQVDAFAAISGQGVTRTDMQEFLATMRASAALLMRNLHRASSLIGNFKKTAVDPSSMHVCAFKLRATVDMIIAAVLIRPTQVSIVNLVDAELEMHSYVGAFGDVVAELIENALRHAFKGRAAGVITIAAERFGQGEILLTVSDDGGGIAQADLARIFDPFFTTTLGQGRNGLGLYTAYNLVNCMRGRIEVASTSAAGTCFALTVPTLPVRRAVRAAQAVATG